MKKMKKKYERERERERERNNLLWEKYAKNGREWQIYIKRLGIRKVKIKEEKGAK